jgi:hypothetical protein
MRRPLLAIFLCAVASTGCAVHELRDDQDKIRCALLDLYTNQIIDNLIRASNGMPIIQIDYTNATATLTVRETATFSDSLATTRSTVLTDNVATTGTSVFTRAAATTLALTKSVVTTLTAVGTKTSLNTLMGSMGGEHTNQVAVTGTPVTTSNDVYDAYLYFLTLPGSLQVSPAPPPPEVAHVCRQCGKLYYWVPAEHKKAFLALSLATTAQRGKPIPAPEAYEVILKRAIGQPVEEDKNLFSILVELDKAIPNDSGRIVFDDGKIARFDAYIPPAGPAPEDTNKLKLFLDLDKEPLGAKTVDQFRAKLPLAKPVKAYVRGRRPESPTTNDLLNRMSFQLQQIQFNQLRSGVAGP